MLRFIIATLWFFLLPVFAYIFIMAILPIDFFSFRCYEALKIRPRSQFLKERRFYPMHSLKKLEEGDLAHHTPFAIRKDVYLEIDKYGYRNRQGTEDNYNVVIVGDSNGYGSTLTQDDMFSEVLSRKIKKNVYMYAPEKLKTYLMNSRFKERIPEIVVFQRVERNLWNMGSLKSSRGSWPPANKVADILEDKIGLDKSLRVFLDRIFKFEAIYYVPSAIKRNVIEILTNAPVIPRGAVQSTKPEMFFYGESLNPNVSETEFAKTVSVIKSYKKVIEKTGARFIFLPVPNKCNIYARYVPEGFTADTTNLARLIKTLKNEGVEVVDTLRPFREKDKEGVLLYHLDDTHWNPAAVDIAASELAKQIGAM